MSKPQVTELLVTAAQKQFYNELRKKRVPSIVRDVFARLDQAFDLFQALVVYIHVSSEDQDSQAIQWQREHVLAPIAAQALRMDAAKLKVYASKAWELSYSHRLDPNAWILPFMCLPGDYGHAIKIWDMFNAAAECHQEGEFQGRAEAALFSTIVWLIAFESYQVWKLLTDAVQNGDAEAHRVFRRLVGNLMFMGAEVRFLAAGARLFVGMSHIDKYNHLIAGLRQGEIVLPVYGHAVSACNRIASEISQKYVQEAERMQKLVAWFGAYEDFFQELSDEYWKDILENASRGLRPDGKDVIAIRVRGLEASGFRYVQLIATPEFHRVRVRFWIYRDYGGRFYTEHLMQPGKWTTVMDGQEDSYQYTFEKLMGFIALESFWRITTNRMVRKSRQIKKSAEGERKRAQLARSFSGVRPHFRWLQPEHRPSDRALQRSLETFEHLPPAGKTFVKSDGMEVSTGKVTKELIPGLIYTEDDLGYSESEEE